MILTTCIPLKRLVDNFLEICFFFPFADVVRFDNTYSWARSKKVHYLIEVLEPESRNGNSCGKKNANTNSSTSLDGQVDEDDDEFVMAQENI